MPAHRQAAVAVLAAAALLTSGCATLGALGALVQPPHFESAQGRRAEIRLDLANRDGRGAAAGVRVWTRVRNPNAFGITLATLTGTLHLDGRPAADVDFPFGLPLAAYADDEVPIDFTIPLSSLGGLLGTAGRVLSGGDMEYELEGRVGVDAGRLGQPTFGPLSLARGQLRVIR